MNATMERQISELLADNDAAILKDWLANQQAVGCTIDDDREAREKSVAFLRLFISAVERGALANPTNGEALEMRDQLADLSRSGAQQGHSPSAIASFVFSLRQPLLKRLRGALSAEAYDEASDALGNLLDTLGLYTTEVHQKRRDEVIHRQQQELMELSTPVVELWDGILALPLIGTLDSARTQVVMESLLERIVETSARIAIIDITGVPTVDTLVAQHLLKTIAAARLMGADCVISGIRPQIAQTIVHLGVDLGTVITKATLAEAFRIALQRSSLTVTRVQNGA
jgi:rsbT co-antagonist protein RsbR